MKKVIALSVVTLALSLTATVSHADPYSTWNRSIPKLSTSMPNTPSISVPRTRTTYGTVGKKPVYLITTPNYNGGSTTYGAVGNKPVYTWSN